MQAFRGLYPKVLHDDPPCRLPFVCRLFKDMPPVSAQQMIERVLIGHVIQDVRSSKKAVGAA